MTSVIVKIINKSPFPLPAYETVHSAGMDLRADIQEPVELKPMQRTLLGTSLFIELPEGHEAQIRPRSGMALKHGLTVLNSPGTIDADYRGEIKILLINLSDQNYTVQPGERIAQMIVSRHEKVNWKAVESLTDTQRGEGGYGHTGNK
ncbi:MAG TPA: dUTP diphosphatase [Bacteroidia bacterium]|nr:dUTP diphosphatase [Bacteroidia bacterium]